MRRRGDRPGRSGVGQAEPVDALKKPAAAAAAVADHEMTVLHIGCHVDQSRFFSHVQDLHGLFFRYRFAPEKIIEKI